MNNPKTLTEFLSARPACEGCKQSELECLTYNLIFLNKINEKQFHGCPCISCIVKVVCEECCGEFLKFIGKYVLILNNNTLPAIEHIIMAYRDNNKHLLKFQVDRYNLTKLSRYYNVKGRGLNAEEINKVKEITRRYK